jgi:O-antigen ligase
MLAGDRGFPERPGVARRRLTPLRMVDATLFSPEAAIAWALVGYYVLAGYVNAVLPEGSAGSIASRLWILFVVIVAASRRPSRSRARSGLSLTPAWLFLALYSGRVFENIYISGVYIAEDALTIFATFILSGIIIAALLCKTLHLMTNEKFYSCMFVLSLAFVLGLCLNAGELIQTYQSRLMLEKINPIQMGHTAFTFLIFYLVSMRNSKWWWIQVAIFGPVFLVIALFSRSAGAYLAGAFAIVAYLVLLTGERRVWLLLGLAAAGAMIFSFANPQYIEIISDRLQRVGDSGDMSTASREYSFDSAWVQFNENVFFGRYIVDLNTGYYPHNIYLEALMSVGVFGSLPLALHLALAFRASIGIIRSSRFPKAAVFTAVLYFREALANAVSGSLWGATGFWISSILTVAFWYGRPAIRRMNLPGEAHESGNRRPFSVLGAGA